MANHPLSQEAIDEAVAARAQYGSMKEAAEALNMNYRTLQSRLQMADRDPAVAEGMQAANTGIVPSVLWVKTKNEDGTSFSAMIRPGREIEDIAERVKTALGELPAIPAIEAPEAADADLVTLYPIADAHIGMQAWGRETGEDYDTAIATARLQEWIGRCVAASPPSETAIILDVGDLLHANDQTSQTPKSKHVLDVDTRFFRTVEATIEAMATAVELALAKHQKVIVRLIPGNHDPEAYLIILFALAERYRLNSRVEVQKEPGEFFAYEFGKVMIAAHHGDKAKAERMVLFLADEFPDMWGRTRHRFLWTGHLHHHKSQDIGGVKHEQLRAVTTRDAYAASHAYCARAQLQAITYHRDHGEIGRCSFGAAA